MRKELFGCLLSSLIIIFLGICAFVCLGYLPLFTYCGPTILPWQTSATVEESKSKNVFMWEYEPTQIQYKDNIIKISSAFLEHHHYYVKEDSLRVVNSCELQIFFEDYRPMIYKGYKETWLIEDYLHAAIDGSARINYYKGELPPDTMVLHIRECTPSLDIINHDPTPSEMKFLFKWDTVQTINLIRKL